MQKAYKLLSKNLGLIALSEFVPRALSFFLTPLYTSILSTADYGISDLISTTVMLLVPIATLDIEQAVMRFALDKEYDNRDVLSIGVQTLLIGTGVVALLAFGVAQFGIPGWRNEYLFFVVLMFFLQGGFETLSLFARGIDEVKSIAVASIVNASVTLLCNILFLVKFKWGLIGYLWANSIGSFLAVVWLFIEAHLWRYIKIRINTKIRKEMYLYSFPLVFGGISWWANNASDRYILTALCGVAVSGLYAIAYKIPSILSAFGSVFSRAWSISAIVEYDSEDSKGFFGNTFSLMNFVMVLICSMILICNIPLAKILYAKDFFEAWHYTPFILFSVLLDTMTEFIGGVFTATRDTKAISYTTIIGAVVNVGLSFLLIPIMGALGAAVATLIGYSIVYGTRLILVRKYIHMKVSTKRIATSYILLLVQLLVSELGLVSIPIQILIFVVLVVVQWPEAKKVTNLFKKVYRKLF